MEKLTQDFIAPHRIDLAREADFALGPLRVRPSRCELEADGVRRVLQRKVMQVLVALARSTSEVVSQRELIHRCWGGLSVSDDAIGRCIAQLRRVAGEWPQPPFKIETIPGVGYRLEASGPAPAAADPRAAPARAPPRLRLPLWLGSAGAAIGLGLAVVGLLAVHRAPPQSSARAAEAPKIAVSLFQAASGGPAAKALAAALPTQVAEALSRYEVTVIQPAAGQDPSSPAPPGADFVVGGRVVERDHRLWVAADLSDARQHVLVYSFDTAQPTGKGDLGDEIANHVALSLDPTKLSNDLQGKLTPADYTLIARANDGIDRWDMPYVLDQTQKLASRHPEDGDLRAGVAIGAILGAPVAPPSQQAQLLDLGRRSIAEAERLSPRSGMLFYAKSLLVNGPMAYAEQERLLRKSMSLAPGFHVTYDALGDMLISVGRLNEGAALLRRGVQLDPMSNTVVNGALTSLVVAGHADEARAMLEREEQIWPGDWKTIASEFYVAVYQGTPEQALDFARRNIPPKGGTAERIMQSLGLEAWATRDPRLIRQMIARCFADMSKPPQAVIGDPTPQLEAPDCLIQMVRLGALDDAFRFAALAYPDLRNRYPVDSDLWITKGWFDPSWLFSPPMKPFRDDPRFWPVAARTGLADYWLTTGSWPDFCGQQLDRCKSLAAAAARTYPPKG